MNNTVGNLTKEDRNNIAQALKNGDVAVLPSDTIYGLFASVEKPKAIERIYDLKQRDKSKPFIIHVLSLKDIKNFGITLTNDEQHLLKKVWPGPFSVILPIENQKYKYLHRGTNGLAFRLIEYQPLKQILQITGPLVGTSVNPEGEKPAETIDEAQKYFGDKIDIYLDAGHLPSVPSTVIEIKDDQIKVLRQGAGNIENIK